MINFNIILPKSPVQHELQKSFCYLLHVGFLLGLFFEPEDGGDMFLRNVG
jgi:hypothetical protein